jgi:hypothetical protein
LTTKNKFGGLKYYLYICGMENKIWHKIEITTEEQTVEVYPTDGFNGIVIETKELDGKGSPRLYLNKDEMEFLILKMQEMMLYVKS